MRRLFLAVGVEIVGVVLLSVCSYIYFREFIFLLMVIFAMIYIAAETVIKVVSLNAYADIETVNREHPEREDLEEAFDDLLECMQEVENRVNG